jgi:VanZ family protein
MQRLFHPKVKLTFFLMWCLAWLVVAALLLAPLPSTSAKSAALAHAVLFGGMALGAVTFCHHPGQLTLLTLLTIAGGTALEFAQGLVPYRTFDLHDAVANVLGATCGYLAALAILYSVVRPAASAAGRL